MQQIISPSLYIARIRWGYEPEVVHSGALHSG